MYYDAQPKTPKSPESMNQIQLTWAEFFQEYSAGRNAASARSKSVESKHDAPLYTFPSNTICLCISSPKSRPGQLTEQSKDPHCPMLYRHHGEHDDVIPKSHLFDSSILFVDVCAQQQMISWDLGLSKAETSDRSKKLDGIKWTMTRKTWIKPKSNTDVCRETSGVPEGQRG